MKVQKYSICGPMNGLTKQYSVMGSCGNYSRPVIYLQRPAWVIDDKQWEVICRGVSINLPAGFEITEPS